MDGVAGRRRSEPTPEILPCPMHEEPLHLIQEDLRPEVIRFLNEGRPEGQRITIEGDLCPFCRQNFKELNMRYGGDWTKIISHIRVRRLILSEKDRIGIGTFQPKDERIASYTGPGGVWFTSGQ